MRVFAACALVLVAGCGTTVTTTTNVRPRPIPVVAGKCAYVGQGLSAAPDRACTPGQWIADPNLSHVCTKGYNPRPPLAFTAPLKREGLKLYGLPPSAGVSTESDHLFPVWLGGATVIQNLWPEPNYPHPVGYDMNPKDKLEFAVYKLTCQSHRLTVAQARAVFEGDWRVGYRKYVGTL
jgi:hypothetical protein